MTRLYGRIAVVTGGTRGLGLATATAFVREGARVVVSSRTAAAVDDVVARLGPDLVEGVVGDVARKEHHESLLATAIARFGGVDVWVNNAGLAGIYGPTPAIPEDDFLGVLDTNVRGVYFGSVVASRHFLAQGSGKLVNILGRGDRGPVPNQNAYAASKGWVRSFTMALASETRGRGIGVFAFQPGLVRTDLVGEVTAVRGYEERLRPFAAVLRLWAQDPGVPAEALVKLVSSATDGRTGIRRSMLTPPRMLAGVLRDLGRRLRREPPPEVALRVDSAEPVVPMDPEAR